MFFLTKISFKLVPTNQFLNFGSAGIHILQSNILYENPIYTGRKVGYDI